MDKSKKYSELTKMHWCDSGVKRLEYERTVWGNKKVRKTDKRAIAKRGRNENMNVYQCVD